MPDSFYSFEESHFRLRQNIIAYLSILISFFKNVFIQQKYDIVKASEKNNLLENIRISLDKAPDPPKQCEEKIRENYKKLISNSHNSFRNFFYQFIEYFSQNRNSDIGKLALYNLKDYSQHLPEMYSGFDLVSSISTDYFNIRGLEENEIKLAGKLIDLFDLYINNWRKIPIYQYEVQIEIEKELSSSLIIQDMRKILQEINVIIADHVFIQYPLSYLPIYFAVDNPLFFDENIVELIKLLKDAKHKPSFYYLIPIYKDNLIIDGGYRISSTIDENNFFWESLIPQNVPENIMAILPMKEKITMKGLSFRTDLLGCLGLIYMWMKLSELLKFDKDDYFVSRLYNKVKEKNIHMYKELTKYLTDFKNNYFNIKEELQITFPTFDLNKIYEFIDGFANTCAYDEALSFLSKNPHPWVSIIKCFGLIDS